jgi:hypothetical protein
VKVSWELALVVRMGTVGAGGRGPRRCICICSGRLVRLAATRSRIDLARIIFGNSNPALAARPPSQTSYRCSTACVLGCPSRQRQVFWGLFHREEQAVRRGGGLVVQFEGGPVASVFDFPILGRHVKA